MFTKDTIEAVEAAMSLHSRYVRLILRLETVPPTDRRYVRCGEIAVNYKLVCEALAASCVRLMLGDK
jgi:hypothetical protein